MSPATARLSAVDKRYGDQIAVTNVDLVLQPGERIALVGHNGAGKSTLIKLMLGLIRPTGGRVEVLGESVGWRSTASRTAVGYLPENVVFPPAMTGRELMAFYARLKRQDVAANTGLLERVGLAAAAGRRVGTYSKGMRQRLGLAQALIGAPKLLLLDEPTTGLDPALRRAFYDIIDELAREGATVLLSSHALAELEPRSDRIVVMNHGRKVADGTLSDLRALARRPTRIRASFRDRARLPQEIPPGETWRKIDESAIEITCDEAGKVAVLGRLMALADRPRDLEIMSPTLDDIYAHFLELKAAE